MNDLKKTLIAFAIFALILGVVYGLGYLTAHHIWKTRWDNRPTVETKTDTLTIRDTVRLPAPKPQVVKIRDTVKIAFTDTVFVAVTDTSVALVRTSVEYRDSSYFATVSGVQPSLDYIEVYNKTQVITNEVTKTLPAPRFSLGVTFGPTVGYGYTTAGAQPFIGVGATVGVQYRF